MLAGEAKRISTAYAEEQNKLDLMMKIQQTRQRQALQRKLWERNQAKMNHSGKFQSDLLPLIPSSFAASSSAIGGDNKARYKAGYGSDQEIDNMLDHDSEEEDEQDKAGQQESIFSAPAAKPSISQLVRDRYAQQSVRGLDKMSNLTVSPTKTNIAGSGMALRGMNLGPLRRK